MYKTFTAILLSGSTMGSRTLLNRRKVFVSAVRAMNGRAGARSYLYEGKCFSIALYISASHDAGKSRRGIQYSALGNAFISLSGRIAGYK
jgi:hypothetical protein